MRRHPARDVPARPHQPALDRLVQRRARHRDRLGVVNPAIHADGYQAPTKASLVKRMRCGSSGSSARSKFRNAANSDGLPLTSTRSQSNASTALASERNKPAKFSRTHSVSRSCE